LFQAPLTVKTDGLIGKFIDQTFHMVGRVRARTTLEIYWSSPGVARPPVKNHWCIISMIL